MFSKCKCDITLLLNAPQWLLWLSGQWVESIQRALKQRDPGISPSLMPPHYPLCGASWQLHFSPSCYQLGLHYSISPSGNALPSVTLRPTSSAGAVVLTLRGPSQSPGGLAKTRNAGPHSQFLIQWVWGGTRSSAILTSLQVRLLLLVLELHVENHCPSSSNWFSRSLRNLPCLFCPSLGYTCSRPSIHFLPSAGLPPGL